MIGLRAYFSVREGPIRGKVPHAQDVQSHHAKIANSKEGVIEIQQSSTDISAFQESLFHYVCMKPLKILSFPPLSFSRQDLATTHSLPAAFTPSHSPTNVLSFQYLYVSLPPRIHNYTPNTIHTTISSSIT